MKVRRLVRNEEFLKNIPDDLVEKLIHLKEPIPMRIHSMIIDYIPNFNMKRNIAIGDDKKLVHKLREERFVARELPALESLNIIMTLLCNSLKITLNLLQS